MNLETIVYCIFAFLLGMLLAHMLKDVCGCKVVEGSDDTDGNAGVPAPARCDPNANPPQHCPGPMECSPCSPSPCTSPCPQPPPIEKGRLTTPCKTDDYICHEVASLYSAKDRSLLNSLTASYVNLAIDISTTGFNWDATPQSQKCLPSEVSTKTHKLIPYYNIKPSCFDRGILSPSCNTSCDTVKFKGGEISINKEDVCPVASYIMKQPDYSPGNYIQYRIPSSQKLQWPSLSPTCGPSGYCDPTNCNSSKELDEYTKKLLTAHYDSK